MGSLLLLSLFLAGCSMVRTAATLCGDPPPRQWIEQSTVTEQECFNGRRLVLPPEEGGGRIELEWIRAGLSERFYINLFSFRAPPTLTLELEGEPPRQITPYILQGEQRLMLPQEEADHLVQALLEGREGVIRIGRYSTSIIANGFRK